MKKRKFKMTKAEVGNWNTDFSISDLEHKNNENSMSPQAFFHHIGELCGKNLGDIKGLEFEIILPGDEERKIDNDPLDLCGKTISV